MFIGKSFCFERRKKKVSVFVSISHCEHLINWSCFPVNGYLTNFLESLSKHSFLCNHCLCFNRNTITPWINRLKTGIPIVVKIINGEIIGNCCQTPTSNTNPFIWNSIVWKIQISTKQTIEKPWKNKEIFINFLDKVSKD